MYKMWLEKNLMKDPIIKLIVISSYNLLIINSLIIFKENYSEVFLIDLFIVSIFFL